jgi:hypothetical protein
MDIARFRQKNNHPPERGMIYSPYDQDARMGAKWETEWQGYKVHLTETVSPDGPQLTTDVQSDVAPAIDREVLTEIQERLQKR